MRFVLLAGIGGLVAVAGVNAQHRPGAGTGHTDAPTARAAMVDTSGKNVGDAYLEESPNGVLMRVDLRQAPPGIHGFHIHEIGRCERPDFESAGDHFAPGGRQHGFLDEAGPHAGDLPNAHVLVTGDTSFEHFVQGVTLSSGDRSLLDADGSALVMHDQPDDYRTDPSGAAGDRIACGVIMR